MATLSDYKNLKIVNGATESGGQALTNNFKALADGSPYPGTADPTVNDDSSKQFAVGALWLNATSGSLWMCTNAAVGAAVWKSILSRSSTQLNLTPGDTSAEVVVPGKLTVSGEIDGTALEVKSAGGTAARFENTDGTMQVLIDAKSTSTSQASFQLRNNASPANDRTLFYRTFSGSTIKDRLAIQHDVGGATKANFYMTQFGDILLIGDGKVGVGVGAPRAKLHATDSTIVGVATAAVADVNLGNGEVNIYVDETNNLLKFKVKYSSGTVKTGSVALS